MLSHLDGAFSRDPHPTWDRLRAEAPVRWVPELDAWLITGHAEAREALRNPSLSPSPRFWTHHQEPAGDGATPRERFLSNGLFYVGPEDHVRLRRLLSAAFTPHGVEQQRSTVADLVHRLTAELGPGDEGRLTEEERVALVAGLVIAGSGTTAQFMAHATVALLDHPDQQRAAVDPGARPAMLEEALRWTTMGYGAPRFAVEGTVVGGNPVDTGAMLFVAFPAANHDPGVFADPHRLDIARDASEHLAFSIGPHFCLGAALARLESEVVLGHVLDRFGPSLRPTGEATFSTSLLFRDVEALPVRL